MNQAAQMPSTTTSTHQHQPPPLLLPKPITATHSHQPPQQPITTIHHSPWLVEVVGYGNVVCQWLVVAVGGGSCWLKWVSVVGGSGEKASIFLPPNELKIPKTFYFFLLT